MDLWPAKFQTIYSHISRQVNQHWTRPAASCYVKGLPKYLRYVFSVAKQVVMLGNGEGNAGYIIFLKSILAYQEGIDLACDGHHRNRIHVGRSNACYQVGGPRSGCSNAHTCFSCSSGITVCHMCRTLLVAN